jgi:hypothetical protein
MTEYTDYDESEIERSLSLRDRAGRFIDRSKPLLARLSDNYLGLLRAVSLIIATLFLVGAAGYLIVGGAMQIGPRDIDPEPVVVIADDIVASPESAAADTPATGAIARGASQPRWQRETPEWFRSAYHELYKNKFAPFGRTGETVVARPSFLADVLDDEFLDRIQAVDEARLTAPADTAREGRAVWPMLLSAMTGAADDPQTRRELQAYKSARRTQVCRSQTVMRNRRVQQWDRFSLACPYWYEDGGCLVSRTITEPEQQRSCSMQFPADLDGPVASMKQLQGQFITTLENKLIDAENAAQQATVDAADRRQRGWNHMSYAVQLFGAFLALMFCFLLVAIERHYRRLTVAMEKVANTE